MTAPTTAVRAETQKDEMKVSRMTGSKMAAMLPKVNAPALSKNPVPKAITVGTARKSKT